MDPTPSQMQELYDRESIAHKQALVWPTLEWATDRPIIHFRVMDLVGARAVHIEMGEVVTRWMIYTRDLAGQQWARRL